MTASLEFGHGPADGAVAGTPILVPIMTDPVVVYDQLIEAKTRLLGAYREHQTDLALVAAYSQTLRARVDAVDINDLNAQLSVARDFENERQELET